MFSLPTFRPKWGHADGLQARYFQRLLHYAAQQLLLQPGAIPIAGAFVTPSALVGRVTLASAAPARSTGAPVLGASRLRLRNAAPAAGLRMAQTFTESETWQQTDIPALLKEAASQFFEGECTFEPCSGGVNNLVQYCQTSSGD